MADSFKISSYPTIFKWLESTVSDLDEAAEPYNGALCTGVYVTTLLCTPITIAMDLCIGVAETAFQVVRHQDFKQAWVALKSKWVEALSQESAFFVIGILTMITEFGNWRVSYRVTKRTVQNLSEHLNLGTPQIFNRIWYPIPKKGLPMPESCVEIKDQLKFEDYNTARSLFYTEHDRFKKKYTEEGLNKNLEEIRDKIRGLNNVLVQVLNAHNPVEVMGLNLECLKDTDVRRRLEDWRECFSSYLDNQAVQEGFKVIKLAQNLLLNYLELPVHVRAEIRQP